MVNPLSTGDLPGGVAMAGIRHRDTAAVVWETRQPGGQLARYPASGVNREISSPPSARPCHSEETLAAGCGEVCFYHSGIGWLGDTLESGDTAAPSGRPNSGLLEGVRRRLHPRRGTACQILDL